ncbi:hypothetical protein, partial [Citrobacter freundii]
MHVSPDAEHLPASKEIIHAMGERRKHCNKYGDARADYKARRDSEPRSVGPISVWTAPQKLDTQLSKVQFFMAKPKYSPETKLAVVNHYLSGKDGE